MNHVSEVVVITGASAGVGRATARKFARHGARIALLARGTDGLEAAQREVEKLGGTAIVVPVDVANAEQVEAAAARVEVDLGKIDIWINNAMASVFSPIKEMTPEEFRRVTEVTYLGRAETYVATRPGHDCASWQRAGVSRYSVTSSLLRGQARDPRLLRLVVVRANSRQKRGALDDGANARAQHAAIWLGEKPFATQSAAGAADFPA